METTLHAARYWFLAPLAVWVAWLVIMVLHDGVGLVKKRPEDEE